jgi:CBS domain-containing protein
MARSPRRSTITPARHHDPKPGSSAWRFAAPLAAIVAAIVAFGYGHTLAFPFHFDDFDWIANNRALGPPLDPAAIWSFRPSRFIPDLTFALQILAWGRDPVALRLGNLVVHALASVLVGWIARDFVTLTRPGARRAATWAGFAAGALFAAHPLATQSVTYVTQRITSLTALLELASVAAFLRARTSERLRWWVASWSCALLAAFSKEMSVALPFALFATEWVLRRSGAVWRASWKRLVPYLIVVPVVIVAARAPLGPEGRVPSGFSETSEYTRGEYALAQVVVVNRYLQLFALPAGQQLDPHVPLPSPWSRRVTRGAMLLALLPLVALTRARRWPLAAIGLLWFVITVAPESSVIPIRDLMNEHRAYLPMAGLCWLVAAGIAGVAGTDFPQLRYAGLAVFAAIVVALAFATRERNEVWRSERALWEDSARKSPGSARAQNNFGLALLSDGDAAGAEAAFRAAIEAEPRHVYARANLGMLYGREGRLDEAISVMREALRYAPADPMLLNNLGTALWQKGDTLRAAAAYERALLAHPGAPGPSANLARLRAGGPPPR